MKYKNYIKDCPKISEIGFGAWQLGRSIDWKTMTESEAIFLVHTAIDLGVNFFDTAPNYGYGTSEERLGKSLSRTDRSKIVINTKFGHTHDGKINFESDNIVKSVEGSLRRLKTDYIDSVIIHNPPAKYLDGNKNDHYEIFEKLITEGKIKGYGASLDTFDEMHTLISTTNSKVIEAFFNILHQDTARAFKIASENAVKIIAKIPLDSGWLSGKYNAESKFDDIRSRWSLKDIKIRAGLISKIRALLPDDIDLAQTAISFCLSYDAVTTVIPGNKNIKQLAQNIESVNNPISKEVVQKLEKFYEEEIKKLKIPW